VDRPLAACRASGPLAPGHLRLAASARLAAACLAARGAGPGAPDQGARALAERLVSEGLEDALSPRRAPRPLAPARGGPARCGARHP